jgi:MarR-like DNA-binding transcriptional regulator SgrR of sgrS sRNA
VWRNNRVNNLNRSPDFPQFRCLPITGRTSQKPFRYSLNLPDNNPWSVAQIQQLITPAANPRQTGQPQLQEPLIAAQQSPADGSKPLITSQQAPVDTSQSLITPTQAPAQQSQQLSETLAGALKETGVKVELTLINDKTGDKKTFTGTGGKIATAMTYP